MTDDTFADFEAAEHRHSETELLDDVLDDVLAAVLRHVALPSPHAAVAVVLFIAATHAQPVWEHATRLAVKSPLKRCGKTRLQEVAGELVHRPLRTTNISVAALVRSIDSEDPPTLMLDEADSVFATRRGERSEGAEDLRGILNCGHSRGWPYIRWNMAARKPEPCPTFAMAIISGIGDLPDTIEDRAVIIAMRRRARSETITPFRRRTSIPPLRKLRGRLHQWVGRHLDELRDADPDLPVEDREADVWAPLVAIADLAGGDWPKLARAACRTLTTPTDPDEATAAERLLADLRPIFTAAATDRLPTESLLAALHGLDEAPWGDWYGKPLTDRALARLLRPYSVRSRNIKLSEDRVVKGYFAADFVDAWTRYTPDLRTPPATSATPLPDDEPPPLTSDDAGSGSVADVRYRSATASEQGEEPFGSGVADVAEDQAAAALSALTNGDPGPSPELLARLADEFGATVLNPEGDTE